MPAKQNYAKPPLSFSDQANLLIRRGLVADPTELTAFLGRVNYYRFSTYLYPFRQPDSENFEPNTSLANVCVLYDFDHALRVQLFSAIATLEIAMLRTHFVEFFTRRYGAFGYTDPQNFDLAPGDHKDLLTFIQQAADRSKEEFVVHFRAKYSDKYLPLWMAAETVSFGNMMTMVLNLHRADKKAYASVYGITPKVMDSWLRSLNYIRNSCAHHARLWNRALAIKPLIPDQRNRPEFHNPPFYNSRIFAILTIVQYLLNLTNPAHGWKSEIVSLLDQYPTVPLTQMGFPPNWQDLQMWRS